MIKLNCELFPYKKVKLAQLAYENYAEINIFEKGNYYYIEFRNCVYGANQTENEFENYLIGLMGQGG